MEVQLREIEVYTTSKGRAPFLEWLRGLKDMRARAKIRVRIERVRLGNFGDHRSLGKGLFELKINFGPGYRVYFGQAETKLVILLCGGDKSSQGMDIEK